MYNEIKLTGVLEREVARILILTWLNGAIEVRQGRCEKVIHQFGVDDFGRLFKTLEWEGITSVRVTIEPI